MTARQRRQIARELAARQLSPDELIHEQAAVIAELVAYNAWLEAELARALAAFAQQTRRLTVAS